jgi:CheY-like chemotaxis protein
LLVTSSVPAVSRVLIAEPDAETRALYRSLLPPDRYDIIEAADGREALTRSLVLPPSLIVTELRLPYIDGFALCQILRGDRLTMNVPILVVTGDVRTSVLDEARKAGVDGILLKPTPPETLMSEVERLVQRSSALRARGTAVIRKAAAQRETASKALAKAEAVRRQHGVANRSTKNPPVAPPSLLCPSCDRPLAYNQSHVGGVGKLQEQWDDFVCTSCGLFQYRHRTRKLRRL